MKSATSILESKSVLSKCKNNPPVSVSRATITAISKVALYEIRPIDEIFARDSKNFKTNTLPGHATELNY